MAKQQAPTHLKPTHTATHKERPCPKVPRIPVLGIASLALFCKELNNMQGVCQQSSNQALQAWQEWLGVATTVVVRSKMQDGCKKYLQANKHKTKGRDGILLPYHSQSVFELSRLLELDEMMHPVPDRQFGFRKSVHAALHAVDGRLPHSYKKKAEFLTYIRL